ncbi:MAG: hypothetical protein ACI88G_001752 [Woeseiaceae bacterium]|jgi:hypothetical protein
MTIRLIAVALLLLPLLLKAQTSPEEFFGHQIGADRKLVDYHQIRAYFEKLDEESTNVSVLTIGQSTLGEPMIMAVITSEENMANLDRYRQITKRLSDPRGLSPEEARQLSQDGKAILLIQTGLHATEIAHSQHSVEFIYRLATGDTPFDADKMLDDVIVLLIPAANPDGQLMVVDWYRKNLGTKHEGGPIPFLYHHYAGHDNNRDGITNNLVETRAISSVMWHDWFPQVFCDHHQSGPGSRIFIPPFIDPADPNIHPLIFSGIDLVGSNMVYDLQKDGLKGVLHGSTYASAWWKGTLTTNAMVHNTTAVFTETASSLLATPIYVDPNEIPEFLSHNSLSYPDPWPGGWWHLRDAVDYILRASMSLVETTGRHKEDLLYNFYKMGKDAVETPRPGDPFAFVVPSNQTDYPTTLRMLEILEFGGTEIHQASETFVADGVTFPSGSFVIFVAQPYRPYVLNMLGERAYPTGVPQRLEDNASHALPLQMGVAFSQIDEAFEASLEKLTSIPHPNVTVPSSAYVVLDARVNASYAVAVALLREDADVYRSTKNVESDGGVLPAGSFIVKNTSRVQNALTGLFEKWPVTPHGLADVNGIATVELRLPRIGLYQSFARRGNMDEGWTRFVFEDFGIPYTTLHNSDMRENLSRKFDVIVFANESPAVIKTGLPSPDSAAYARSVDALPAEYQGGLGAEGIKSLADFVGQGGVLVALDNAGPLFAKELNLPIKNALEGLSETEFFVPTSLLKIEVDNQSPIGYGMPAEAAALFFRSVAYSTWLPPSGDWDRQVVASYPQDNVLLRGWTLGEDKLTRRAAVVDAGYKDGRVILIGFRSQHRGQTHGTYKFLFNAVLYPDMN